MSQGLRFGVLDVEQPVLAAEVVSSDSVVLRPGVALTGVVDRGPADAELTRQGPMPARCTASLFVYLGRLEDVYLIRLDS